MTPAGNPDPNFTLVLRGYDCAEVDAYLAQARPGGSPPPRFKIVLRGYDRADVDRYIAGLQEPR